MFNKIIALGLVLGLTSSAVLLVPSVSAVESKPASAVITTSNMDQIVKILSNEIGEIKPVSKKPASNEASYIVIADYTKKDKKAYVVLSPDQTSKLYAVLPTLQEKLKIVDASGQPSSFNIIINCNISYPPLRIKCTITIDL